MLKLKTNLWGGGGEGLLSKAPAHVTVTVSLRLKLVLVLVSVSIGTYRNNISVGLGYLPLLFLIIGSYGIYRDTSRLGEKGKHGC